MADAEQEQVRGVDVAGLRALAERATPGCWVRSGPDGHLIAKNMHWSFGHAYALGSNADDDAAFIAAANPAVVLGLLDELERLRADAADWRRVTERAWAGCTLRRSCVADNHALGCQSDRRRRENEGEA